MTSDLENKKLLDWIRSTAANADYVITLCDGAFPLAATGLLNGRTVTTFPDDRDALRGMFSSLDVRYEPNSVVDGKYITLVGGALSYQPALYLIETLYTPWHAEEIGKGLVLDWNLDEVPYLIVSQESANE